ncbi:MAG: hypothetical protein GAK28_01858 [Luteibacter sp.]|uniref:hypothetical protein n=1 Tax=Luteibacter sp. TaxID=1886636 RepID=UPI001382B807|nr:hypothetical protein [Luteibacter sp.]KAF1007516.1 MAG: hypothetical protein GAK28_01858 [Luteibacter sp.]
MDTLTDRKKTRNAVSNKKRGKTRHTVAWSPDTYDSTFNKPLPPGPGEPAPQSGIFDLNLNVPVIVTDVGARQTIPVSLLDDPIEVTTALWVEAMGGDGAGIGDTYLLRLEWEPIDARGHVKARQSKTVDRILIESEGDLVDPIVMHIPPEELED